MPAQRLGTDPVAVFQFDVVGLDSPMTLNYVSHVAFSAEHRPAHHPAAELPVSHMRPPLGERENFVVTTVGSIPLNAGEVQRVGVFFAERHAEYAAARRRHLDQYVVHPHVVPVPAPDGTVVCYRYSCVGFVIEAYDDAGIPLLVLDEARLPMVGLPGLLTAYPAPAFQRRLSDPAERAALGLAGNGPWPVVLAGYVLNALARTESEIRAGPYVPSTGDECFPPLRN